MSQMRHQEDIVAEKNPVVDADKKMPTAGAYEDQKNSGNRNRESDESIGGAEKGGPGLNRAQSRMPPDADKSSESKNQNNFET